MKMSSLTHQGLVRINNEDTLRCDAELGLAVLADGMGGLLAGEEASLVATTSAWEALCGLANTQHVDNAAAMVDVVMSAHTEVGDHARRNNYGGKMGTTLVVWSWLDGAPTFAHVGDSRLYAFQNGTLRQLTHDHTVAQRMIDEGLYSSEDAHNVPNQNVLTQAIGMPGHVKPECGTTPAEGRLLLCSDGLSDLVRDDVIAQCMEASDIDECVRALVKAALDAGGRDNVSVVVVDLAG